MENGSLTQSSPTGRHSSLKFLTAFPVPKLRRNYNQLLTFDEDLATWDQRDKRGQWCGGATEPPRLAAGWLKNRQTHRRGELMAARGKGEGVGDG